MNSKKTSILLLIISGLILVTIIVGAVVTSINKSKSVMDEFYSYYNRNENTIIYYASSQCGYCTMQTPILEQLAKTYNLDYLSIDSIKLSSDNRNEILEKLGIEHATPTTVVVKNGEVVATAIGYKAGNAYVEFLKEAGVLPENAKYNDKAGYEDAPNITVINMDDFEELVEKGDLFIVTIGQTGCSHCNAIRPALDRVVTKNDLTIYYLNLTDMDTAARQAFYTALNDLNYSDPSYLEDGSFGTPTTFTIEDGKIKYYIGGERTYSQLVTEFKKQGLIAE